MSQVVALPVGPAITVPPLLLVWSAVVLGIGVAALSLPVLTEEFCTSTTDGPPGFLGCRIAFSQDCTGQYVVSLSRLKQALRRLMLVENVSKKPHNGRWRSKCVLAIYKPVQAHEVEAAVGVGWRLISGAVGYIHETKAFESVLKRICINSSGGRIMAAIIVVLAH